MRAKIIILISFLHFRFDKAICTIADQAKQPGFRIHKYATTSVSPIQELNKIGFRRLYKNNVPKLVTVWKLQKSARMIFFLAKIA